MQAQRASIGMAAAYELVSLGGFFQLLHDLRERRRGRFALRIETVQFGFGVEHQQTPHHLHLLFPEALDGRSAGTTLAARARPERHLKTCTGHGACRRK
jgi:hypothetical protein